LVGSPPPRPSFVQLAAIARDDYRAMGPEKGPNRFDEARMLLRSHMLDHFGRDHHVEPSAVAIAKYVLGRADLEGQVRIPRLGEVDDGLDWVDTEALAVHVGDVRQPA